MDLADPTAKMGKTASNQAGVLFVLDPPEVLRRKIARAVTDPGSEVRYDPAGKPGVSNLLDILAACTGEPPATLAARFDRYAQLKAAVADAVVAELAPVRARYTEIAADQAGLSRILRAGAERAGVTAAATVGRVRSAVGLRSA
jgi:tryptophanyl-tRNA synthetase